MKALIFILLLFVNNTFAQKNDCSKYIQKPENLNGGNVLEIKKNIDISSVSGKYGLSFYMLKHIEENIFTISISALDQDFCISKNDSVKFVFIDGSSIILLNDTELNCKGNVKINFGWRYGRKEELIHLKSKRIKSVIIDPLEIGLKVDFSSGKSDYFFNAINCLNN